MYDNVVAAISELKDLIQKQDDKLNDIQRELALTRKGHEASTWGEEVEEMEDVELENVPMKENEE